MNIDLVLGLLVGLVVGLGLALVIVKMRGGDDSAAIKKLEEEHEKYRKEVDSHFVKTAGLFKGLTDQYRDVYKHMAEGADELCSEEVKTLQSDLAATGLLTQTDDVVADTEKPETGSATAEETNKVEETVVDVQSEKSDVDAVAETSVEDKAEPAKDHVTVVDEKQVEKKTEADDEKKTTDVQPAKDHVAVAAEEKTTEEASVEKNVSPEEDFPLASEVEIPSELAEEKKK